MAGGRDPPHHLGRCAREHGPEPAGGGDQRRRLVPHHPQVVLQRVGAVLRPDRLGDLPADQLREGVGLDADGLVAEVGQDPRGAGEQEVAGEDGDHVAPPGIRALVAAPDRRLVHHVVVVEGGEVGQLDGHRGGHDPLIGRVAELGRQQHQGGPEALAASVDEMPGRPGEQGLLRPRRLPQALLDPDQALAYLGLQRAIGQFHRDSSDHSGSQSSGAQCHQGVMSPPGHQPSGAP